jgi:hypothetical protein
LYVQLCEQAFEREAPLQLAAECFGWLWMSLQPNLDLLAQRLSMT